MALVVTVAWGLATISLLLPLLLLLCSFFHRKNQHFSSQKIKEKPELAQVVKPARLGSSNGEAALPGGTPSPGEPQQRVGGPVVPGDLNNPVAVAGDPVVQSSGHTPHFQALSKPTLRTPEFLRHRQLPVLPGDANTPTPDPVMDTEGRIYESIRYKSRTLKNPWDADSAPGDSPSLPTVEKTSTPVLENITQEELDSKDSPCPVYARVCKMPRPPQQTTSSSEPPEEAPPALPEKHFDVV